MLAAEAGDWGNLNAEWRPLVAASSRHGLVDGEVHPHRGHMDEPISSATSESSNRVCSHSHCAISVST